MHTEPSLSAHAPLEPRPGALGDWIRTHSTWIAVLILVGGVALAASAVSRKSVTVDEFSVLPHGLGILKTGSFHLDPGIPPLASEFSAVPLLWSDVNFHSDHFTEAANTWMFGERFMRDNASNYHELFMHGRIVPLLFLLATGLLTYGFARSLYGREGGLLTAAVVAPLPSLLAHGGLITPDIFLTAGFVGVLWAFDGLLRRPGWKTGCLLGIALGVATLAKFTGLLLCVILPLLLLGLTIVAIWRPNPELSRRKAWLAMLLAGLVMVTVINLGYGFAGAFTRIGEYEFQTTPFRAIQQTLPATLPIPLPFRFVRSMDTQFGEGGYIAYLLGEFNQTGFWHYYIVGLLVKTPVPLLLLCLLALLRDARLSRREVPMLITAGLIFGFFSLTQHKNIGIRYVLFVEPIMAVWIGRSALDQGSEWRRFHLGWATVLVLWLWGASILHWPNYLTYFNEVSGGPANGHKYLLDSNLDWGQDLIALREYMRKEGIDSIELAYFGRVDPAIYGIPYHSYFGDSAPPSRHVAISANLLWGRNYYVNGTSMWSERDAYKGFRTIQPRAVLGHTIYVFDMERLKSLPR